MERMDEKLYELSHELVEGMGFALIVVDEVAEHGRRVFRFYIDSPGGVGIDECASVSRELAYLLDARPELSDGYVLEVSSPGLDHRLKKEREYAYFTGRDARLVLRVAVNASNVIVGRIAGAENGIVRVAPAEGDEVDIPLDEIARARLVV